MNHGRKIRKFGRENDQRRALMRGLANALITHGRIQTTEAKAKSLRPYIEKLITKSKAQNLAARRSLVATVGVQSAAKLIKEIGPRFIERPGGYTRIRRLLPRVSDGAKMAVIEFVG